jgi:ketosteroid isomerase-like protein
MQLSTHIEMRDRPRETYGTLPVMRSTGPGITLRTLIAIAFAALTMPPLSASANDALVAQTVSPAITAKLKAFINDWTEDLLNDRLARWEDLWADDAVLMPANHPRLVGRNAIKRFSETNLEPGLSYNFDAWSFAAIDDMALISNRITWTTAGPNGASRTYNQLIFLRPAEGSG